MGGREKNRFGNTLVSGHDFTRRGGRKNADFG